VILTTYAVSLPADFPEMGKAGKIVGARGVFPHGSCRLVDEVGATQFEYWRSSTHREDGRRCGNATAP
jgi:hypothetical protein